MSISRDDFGGTYVLGNCLSAPSFDFNGKSVTVPTTIDYPWYVVHYGPTGTYDWHHFINDLTYGPGTESHRPGRRLSQRGRFGHGNDRDVSAPEGDE